MVPPSGFKKVLGIKKQIKRQSSHQCIGPLCSRREGSAGLILKYFPAGGLGVRCLQVDEASAVACAVLSLDSLC